MIQRYPTSITIIALGNTDRYVIPPCVSLVFISEYINVLPDMTKIPRLRCPVCGMVAYLRNLERNHRLDSFLVHYGGRGNIKWETVIPEGDNLIDFWINRLEYVITWLKNLRKSSLSLTIIPNLTLSGASVPSVLIQRQARLRSSSQETSVTLKASKVSLKIS